MIVMSDPKLPPPPGYPELVSDVLVSEPWIIEHRTQPDECSFAVEVVKPLFNDYLQNSSSTLSK
jgi:hypothetical protein